MPARCHKETSMKKALTLLLAGATVAGTLMVSTTDADAQRRGRWVGPAIVGGILGGAIIGSAIASRPYYYGDPVYAGPGPYCYFVPGEPVWNGYRWVRPRVQVCE
jgi:hypothetical protein